MDKTYILNLVQSLIQAIKQPKEIANFPDVQEVRVLNEPKEIEFPEVQKVEITNHVEMPPFPEIPATDMSETNALLKQVIERLNRLEQKEKEDINITLDLK